ncbi:MAG TPA: thioesterase family protein [Candidatus Deferrimicrobiaceae bacterium]
MEKVASIRVIYGDTDAMGIVYYGNYLRWFEVGRAELMRRRGFAYREMNDDDAHLPVVESHAAYRSPARYDDVIDVFAEVCELRGVRLKFGYRIARASDGKTLVEGHTVHAFTDSEGRVIRPSKRFKSMFVADESCREGGGE